jgi:beta-carotene 3-hydroxylase
MWFFVFTSTFIAMELIANLLHRYAMHGFLWSIHQDHHVPHQKLLERNDLFALVFAIPSFLMILFSSLYPWPLVGAVGFGVMAYGAAYFFIHEIIIHRRFKFFRGKNFYFLALIIAHREHHKVQGKEGAANFGMLLVSARYFREAWSRRSKPATP